MFPALTFDREIGYVQTRYVDPGEHRSKYDNPAGRLGDNPKHGWTQPTGQPKQPIVICEGFPDAYTANKAGYTAIAVLGALNATPALVEQLVPRIGNRPVIIAFDGDDAGLSAAKLLTEAFGRRGILVAELPLPSGTDLNSWAHTARQIPELGPTLRPTPTPGLAISPTLATAGP